MVKAMVTVSQNSLTLLRIQPSTCSRKVYWEWKRLGRAGWREKKEIRQKGERLPFIYDIIPIILFALSRKCQMRKEWGKNGWFQCYYSVTFGTMCLTTCSLRLYRDKFFIKIFCRLRLSLSFRRKLDSIISKLHQTNPSEKEGTGREEKQVTCLFCYPGCVNFRAGKSMFVCDRRLCDIRIPTTIYISSID